jgi:hypothetical protein
VASDPGDSRCNQEVSTLVLNSLEDVGLEKIVHRGLGVEGPLEIIICNTVVI